MPSCYRCVDGKLTCSCCKSYVVKNDFTKGRKQRYRCAVCSTSKVLEPAFTGFGKKLHAQLVSLVKEGCGIRSSGRILNVSTATVIRNILSIADAIAFPVNIPHNGTFQVDELHTFVASKRREICVIYSWSKELKQAMSLTVGTRSKVNLRSVVTPLISANAKNINTDRYSGYVGVIPKEIHTTVKRRNNHIERQNLNLRTHLKRLNRRTICFSKSAAMLLAVVKIYFWG